MQVFAEFSGAMVLIDCQEGQECASFTPNAIKNRFPLPGSGLLANHERGHHIQMGVKFLPFKGKNGEKARRFQYTAIDDATRVRALQVYEKHTQAIAIDFVNHIIEKFPFRIREIRTDNTYRGLLRIPLSVSGA